MTDGRISRSERRLLLKEDARYLPLPLDQGRDPRSLGAHLRHTVRLLQDRSSRSPCSDAAAHVTTLYERTVPANPDIACRKGCSYCCSQDVSISAPEAFRVAAAIRHDRAAVAAVLEADARLSGVQPEERLGQVLCPLLAEAACSIYPSRPLACHGFVSVSLPACIATFVEHQEPNIPMPQSTINTLYAMRMILKAALRLLGLDDNTYEMTRIVAVVLRQSDAEKRWLNGENVFAGIKADPPIPPQFDVAINQMTAYVAPTL